MTVPSWVSTLQIVSIASDMTAADIGGAVTYSGLEKLIADLASTLASSGTTLTAAEFSDLKTIAANLNNGTQTSSYLTYLFDALVNGNAANATWTDGASSSKSLGNLGVGSSATQLSELNDKWFLGTDLPSSTVKMSGYPTFSVGYSSVIGPLFGANGPSTNDINQGYLGDCYFLASLAEVAGEDPAAISSMFTSNGNGTYGVRFYVDGIAEYVTINSSLPDSGTIFNNAADTWASLAEKAYAQLQTGGAVTGNTISGNSWTAIGNGGDPEYALEEITGASAITDFDADGNSWEAVVYNSSLGETSYSLGNSTASVLSTLISDLAVGDDLVLSSYTNATNSSGYTTLVADHAMSIYSYDSGTGLLEIRNPWGTEASQYWETTFEVSLSTLLADGDTITGDNVGKLPTLTVTSDNSATRGQQIALSTLVTISDLGNVGYQMLQLWDSDGTPSGGEFLINGVAQTGGLAINVSPANVANTVFDVGTLGGTDTLWAQLVQNNGSVTGWEDFTVTAPAATLSTLTVTSDNSAAAGQTIALSSLVTISDLGNVGYQMLQLWDSDGTPSGGEFLINGVAQTGGHAINVPLGANVVFEAGTSADTDILWAQLIQDNGISTGWKEFSVTVPTATLTVTSDNSAAAGQTIALSSLVTISDLGNVGYQMLQLWDSDGTPSGGEFLINGVAQTGGHAINVPLGANVVFEAGTSADTDILWAQLIQDNGISTGWKEFSVTVPTATLTVTSDNSATRGQQIALSTLVTISDLGNVGYQMLQLWDSDGTPSGGEFLINGVAQTGGHAINVSPANVANTVFDVGTLGGTDTLWAQLVENNGSVTGWQEFTVSDPQSVAAGAMVDLASAYAGVVTFVGTTGTLQLADSSTFKGTVAGLSGQDTLDLPDINPATVETPIYSGTAAGGTLTVTDHTHIANIALLGQYSAAAFVATSDGHGGTLVSEEPAQQAQTLLSQPQHG